MDKPADLEAQVEKLITDAKKDCNSSPVEKRDIPFTDTLRSCCNIVPQRVILGFMGCLGFCNAYTMRVCLNMAITQMVNHTKTVGKHFDPDACPSDVDVSGNSTVTAIERPYAIYDWDEKMQGFILSGFYYGYMTTQIISGWLCERFGAKWILGSGLLSTAIFTLLTPVVIRSGGSSWLFALRVVEGMGEGPTLPALMTMLSKWIPPNERSFYGAFVFGGGQTGTIFGTLMSGILLADGKDWANVFYFFGGFGILWFILWSFLCYSSPSSHPYISKKELDFLNENVKVAENRSVKDPIPWKAIIRSPPLWSLAFAAVGHDWGFYTMVTDLPKYSYEVLKFDISATGTLTCLPYVALLVCSFIFGFLCDYCVKKKWHSIKAGRIIHTSIASTGPAICIILASYAGCDRTAAMAYFIASMAFMGAYYSGMRVNILDLSPNYAGTVTSVLNTLSTLTGIISPYLVGLMTPHSTLIQWRSVFWVCFVILVGTNIMYVIWADGKQQWWDDVRQYGYPSNWKHGPILPKEEGKLQSTNGEKFKKVEENKC